MGSVRSWNSSQGFPQGSGQTTLTPGRSQAQLSWKHEIRASEKAFLRKGSAFGLLLVRMTEEGSVLLSAHGTNLITDCGRPPTGLENATRPWGITGLS